MNIKIYEDRRLLNEDNNFGSENENLATTLVFEFPEYIEKDGVQIATKDLNKTIVFDIEGDNELPIDDDNKFSFPYEITKLGEVVWNICLKEKSETEDMTDKLIWYSETMKSTFIKTNEGHNEITTEKIAVFNSMLTRLNNGIAEVEELKVYIENFKKDVEDGKFNGKDGQDGYTPVRGKDYWTPEDRTEIINEIDNKVQEDLKNYYLKSETYNKEEIDNKISLIPKFDIKVVDKLPTENIEEATVYLVKSGEESNNLYTEYIYTDGKWEQLGTQKLDLSGFYNKDEINSLLATRDSKITALQNENKSQTERIETLEKENANQAEELETLWKDYKEKEVEGESVAISDGIWKPKTTIRGMSKQNTTEGYQLVDFSKYKSVSNYTTYSFQNDVATIKSDDGVYQKVVFDILDLFLNNAGKKLYFNRDNFETTGDTTYTNQIEYVTDGTKKYIYNTSGYFSIPEDITNVTSAEFCLYANNSNTAKQGTVILTKPRVTFNANEPYEPYTGGQASPNTGFPQDIEVITECSLVQRNNYFDGNFRQGNYANVNQNNRIFSTQELIIEKGKTLTLLTNLDTSIYKYAVALAHNRFPIAMDDYPFFDSGWQQGNKYNFTTYQNGYFGIAIARVDNANITLEEIKKFSFILYDKENLISIDLAGNSIAKVGEIKDLLNIGVDGSVSIEKKTNKENLKDLAINIVVKVNDTITRILLTSSIGHINNGDVLSNYFKYSRERWVENPTTPDIIYEWTDTLNHAIHISSDLGITTKEQAKDFIDGLENAYLYTQLQTPQTITLPSIEPITLFEGTNIFELVTNLGTTMAVTYKVSNKSRLEALENAVLSIGGNV